MEVCPYLVTSSDLSAIVCLSNGDNLRRYSASPEMDLVRERMPGMAGTEACSKLVIKSQNTLTNQLGTASTKLIYKS